MLTPPSPPRRSTGEGFVFGVVVVAAVVVVFGYLFVVMVAVVVAYTTIASAQINR